MRRGDLPKLGLLFCVAGTASCGGSSLSHAEFVSRANAACERQGERIDRIRRPGVLEFFGDYLGQTLPILREQRDAVADLDAPSDDAERHDDLLESWDEIIGALEEMHEQAKAASDIGIVTGLRRAAALEDDADAAARDLGLRDCVGFNPFTR